MSLGETTLDVSVEFFGVQPSAAPLLLDARELYGQLQLSAPFRRTPVEPEVGLRVRVRVRVRVSVSVRVRVRL
jgi:hypothetical protein